MHQVVDQVDALESLIDKTVKGLFDEYKGIRFNRPCLNVMVLNRMGTSTYQYQEHSRRLETYLNENSGEVGLFGVSGQTIFRR